MWTKEEIKKTFKGFNRLQVMIIGDVMLDHYLIGKVNRLSPEAPVPIVNIERKEYRLGGAGNVIQNVAALGANPIVCSVIGKDAYTTIFLDLLKQHSLNTSGIVSSSARRTTVKTRVIGNNHQLIRLDEEMESNLEVKERKLLFNRIVKLIGEQKVDVIIFEDYDKGVISKELIEEVVVLARKNKIPVVVDPKKKNFMDYKGVDLFKPNLKELKEGLKIELDPSDKKELNKAVGLLMNQLHLKAAFVTLSERGVYIKDAFGSYAIPAHIRNIADVSGAGDTVISVAACCLALGLPSDKLAALSNIAGGLVCEEIGAVPINKELFFKEALKLLA